MSCPGSGHMRRVGSSVAFGMEKLGRDGFGGQDDVARSTGRFSAGRLAQAPLPILAGLEFGVEKAALAGRSALAIGGGGRHLRCDVHRRLLWGIKHHAVFRGQGRPPCPGGRSGLGLPRRAAATCLLIDCRRPDRQNAAVFDETWQHPTHGSVAGRDRLRRRGR